MQISVSQGPSQGSQLVTQSSKLPYNSLKNQGMYGLYCNFRTWEVLY